MWIESNCDNYYRLISKVEALSIKIYEVKYIDKMLYLKVTKKDYEKINKYYVRSCHKGVHYFRFIVNYMWNAGGEVENILIIWVENTLIHKAVRQNNMFREIITYASSISKIGFCSLNLSKSEQLMIPEYLKNLGIKEEIDMPRIFSNLEHAHPDDRKFFLEYIEKAGYERMEPLFVL